MADAASAIAPSGLKPWQKKLIWFGVAALGMASTYLVGRFQTSGKIDLAEQQAHASEELASKRLAETKTEQNNVQQLEARRQMHLMLIALDQRNFGIASQHKDRAAKLLADSAGSSDELAKLARDIQDYRLVATEELGTQRDRVLGWVQRFDQALPPPS